MTHFTFSTELASQQYVKIKVVFPTNENVTEIQLPAWRPGRYELGNFAKNIRAFKVFNENNQLIPSVKVANDRWEVETGNTKKITVEYHYYADQLNAGSTFIDDQQLYVNPVNCCVHTVCNFEDPVQFELNMPGHWNVAGSMVKNGQHYEVDNFDELYDTPFIASDMLQHCSYESGETTFHVWFNGEVKVDEDRIIKDFKAFTDSQISKFTEFPVKEFHFLNQILPYKAYHGVEHQKSTVIALGPSCEVFGSEYKDLLGVSSHELYHAWNVKAIRPIEMYPYDFTKENFSRLGYLCEGVTTYQGDLFLRKSGVFNDQQYFDELDRQLQRHFDNHARFNYSVAESSFDTWLDGYEFGAPGRKVSIYTEGCLLSFVIDVRILRATNNKYGIDEVMKRLYFNYALEGKGVSESDYREMIEAVSGESFEEYFTDYINDCKPFESILTDAFEYLGLEMKHVPANSYSAAKLGFLNTKVSDGNKVARIYPGSPAEMAGLMINDNVIGINGYVTNGDLDTWLEYFKDDSKKLTIVRNGRLIEFILPEVDRNFYMTYSVHKLENPNGPQKKAFEAWIS